MFTPLSSLAVLGLATGALVAGELAIEKQPFEVTTSVEASVMPADPVTLLRIEPKAWSQFTITTIADHGTTIKKGDLLAVVDPTLYQASVDRDKANIASRDAEVNRIETQLKLAKANMVRADELKLKDRDFISQAEMDQLEANLGSLEAQLLLAKAAVDQAIQHLESLGAIAIPRDEYLARLAAAVSQ